MLKKRAAFVKVSTTRSSDIQHKLFLNFFFLHLLTKLDRDSVFTESLKATNIFGGDQELI